VSAYRRLAWAVLAWNVLVVAWGAFVRASGSGAGCGRHWPTCNGAVVPRSPGLETAIEFTHRATSGIALVLVATLLVWALRAFPRGSPARRAAIASAVLLVVEALVGAGLVLFGWVARDASPERGWVMAVHLTNTFLLLAALALAAAWAGRPGGLSARGRGATAGLLAGALATTVLAGVTGAIAALGDTLFPAASFAEGLRAEMSPGASLLLRLRVLHPPVAVAAALLAVAFARAARRDGSARPALGAAVVALALVQTAAGILNLALAAPVWMQVVHLVLADLLWIALVLLGAESLAPRAAGTAGAGAPIRAGGPPALGRPMG
jgi:cytochrome c oxidase assembly protein subunit 15